MDQVADWQILLKESFWKNVLITLNGQTKGVSTFIVISSGYTGYFKWLLLIGIIWSSPTLSF